MDLKISLFPINQKLLIFSLFLLIVSCSSDNNSEIAEKDHAYGQVNFSSSDPELNTAWDWAKKTALSYVREGDSVGLWYEAALPGREAFCMRDVSHQASGAAVLGLDEHTKNMFLRFAENTSEPKDWCSYWEINKDNQPAPVDYKNDKDFWYNLPANFDVIDACFRMFLWTGDSSYITDPVFLNFYSKSLNEYVERWDLRAEKIMSRNRLMNLPEGATAENHYYYDKRGIPGYFEGAGGKMQAGIDLLAVAYAANNWYHYRFHQGSHSKYLREANKIDSLIRHSFWDDEKKAFKIIAYEDGSWDYSVGLGQDFSYALLHYNALEDPEMINSILNNYSQNKDALIIELASHMPNIFFRHGRADDGLYMLKYLTDSTTHRREYPENPFSVVGSFVSGLMGVDVDASENFISTYSGLTDPESWALLEDLPLMNKNIDLLHQGRHTSVLFNHSSDTIFWQPSLEGIPDVWYLNGKESHFIGEVVNFYGTAVSTWFIPVAPKAVASISAFPGQ